MVNNPNSLQFLKHSTIFANREDALAYLIDAFRPNSLVAEPAVVFYEGTKRPNAMIAIGTGQKNHNGQKSIFVIDTAKLHEEVAEASRLAGENHDEVVELSALLNNVVTACGLDYDTNKKENQISYEANVKDAIIGTAENLNDAVNKLSAYVQEHVSDAAMEVKESKSVLLAYGENKNGGMELSAAVKISTEGDDDDLEYNDNVIGVKSDGIFASVGLFYDEDKNALVFTTSGVKNGKFKTDAKKHIIKLPEAPTAHTLEYKDSTVFDTLNKIERDVKELDYLDVEVNAVKNTLTIASGRQKQTVDLPGLDIVKSVEYKNGHLVFEFKNGSTAKVPVRISSKPTASLRKAQYLLQKWRSLTARLLLQQASNFVPKTTLCLLTKTVISMHPFPSRLPISRNSHRNWLTKLPVRRMPNATCPMQ